MDQVANNIAAITARMDEAAQLCGRSAAAVTLVAVSKMQADERIDAALAAGQRVFGENRVQEAQKRWAARRASYPDLMLHLIGPLQTNKAADAVALFDMIHSIDRESIAQKLAAEMIRQNRAVPCLIQVNTGAEPQKAGIMLQDLAAFFEFCARACGLDIRGLMCIPPVDDDAAAHFEILRDAAARLGLPELSMGMSGDFETAIAYGATFVRVGTALFGER